MMFADAFASFAEHGERDAEAAIGGFGSGDGLEEDVDGRAAIERGKLRRDVREAAGLRGDVVGFDEAREGVEDRRDRLDRVGGGIHTDDGVAAAVEQAFERGEENAADVVEGMIRLDANAEDAALAHRIAAARDVADARGGEDEILVAHDFCGGGRDFGDQRALGRAELSVGRDVVEKIFAEFADGHALERREGFAVVGVEDEAGDVVRGGIDEGLRDDFGEREIGEPALGGDAFALGARGDAGELIAGLLFVGLREKLAEVGECEALGHRWDAAARETGVLVESSINRGLGEAEGASQICVAARRGA